MLIVKLVGSDYITSQKNNLAITRPLDKGT